jgi:hypothetical protein
LIFLLYVQKSTVLYGNQKFTILPNTRNELVYKRYIKNGVSMGDSMPKGCAYEKE